MASSKKPPVGTSKPVAPAVAAPVPSAAPKAPVPAPAPVAKPVEVKPEVKAESKPVEAKPAPVAAKVAESKPVVTKPVEVKTAPAPAPAPAPVAPPPPAAEAPKPAPVAVKPAAPAPKAEKPAAAKATVVASMDVLKPVTVLQENVRASTEKAITVFRGQYAEAKTFAETATTKLEDSMKAAQEGSRALGFKFFEIAKAQTQAHLDHAKSLAAAKSLPELLSAQQSFLVAQIERAQAGGKDVAALASRVANDVSAPLQASLNLLLRR